MCPICNMDGCTQPSVSFMASTLPERKRKIVDELHLGGTGIGETGIEPGVDKRFQKGLCTIDRRVFRFLVRF